MSSGRGAQRSDLEDTATNRAIAEMPAQPFQQAADEIRDRNTNDDDGLRSRRGSGNEDVANDAFANSGTGRLGVDDADERKRALAVIKDARKTAKQGRQVSARTTQGYKRKATGLHADVGALDGDLRSRWMCALSEYATRARSFIAYRAAVTSQSRVKLRMLLSEQCKLQREKGMTPEWFDIVQQLDAELKMLNIVENLDRAAVLESIDAVSVRATSRRRVLHRLPADWRQQLIAHSQFTVYGDAVCVLAAIGCRPEELTIFGIQVHLQYHCATFTVRGAKYGASAGQKWRELDVDWKWLPKHFLEPLQDNESVSVGIWSTAGLRSALARMGKKLWPQGPRISPILFRHAAAEDMRESGWTPAEIGAALGHRVGETSSQYGRKRRPGQGRGGVTPTAILRDGVRTQLPVRTTPALDLARPPWKGGKASKSPKTRPR